MLTILSNRAAQFGALLATSMLTGVGLADAKPARLKHMAFSVQDTISEVHVISTDGKSWNAIKNGNLQFYGTMNVETKHLGVIRTVGVVLGQCANNTCLSMPKVWSYAVSANDWSGSQTFSFNPKNIPLSGQGIAVIPDGDAIRAKCNQHLQADGPTKSYSFTHSFRATLVADTYQRKPGDFIPGGVGEGVFPSEVDEARSDSFTAKVVCDAVIKPSTDDLASSMPDFKPSGVTLFLATVNGPNTDGPNPAMKCPALKVTTRVQTTKAGGVDVRLWRKQGNGPTTSEFKSAWASFNPDKNGYFADIVRVEKFDATTYLQFMAEVVGGTFAPSSPWKDITVHCTGAGGGGLSNGQQDTGQEKPKPTWAGTVTLADSAGTKKRCPRKGQAVFAVTRDAPGNFKYKLSCSNGQGFSGSVVSYSQGGPTFEAYGAHDLNINRTRTIQCTLQEVKDSGARVTLDKGSFDYTCNKPAFDPQADDLASAPNPTHAEPKPGNIPGVIIDCAPGFKLVGKKCIKKPVIAVLCKSGEVLKGKTCVKKPVVSILCAKGFKLEGKKCVKLPRLVSRAKPRRAVVVR